jgi:hypothetical protein
MSGYASNDHGYSAYGGYASTPLIERYSITDQLDGPGTSAYAQYGNVTAYAHENLNGAIFEEDVAQFGNLYQVATSYTYETETGSYSHYSYFGSDPDGLGGSGYGYGYGYSYHPTAAARYSASDRTSVADGSYTTNRLTTVLYASYTNGSYFEKTSVQGSTFSDGQFIPGSTVSYGSSSYYDAATSYTTTHAYPD